jgi:hypothetical protein
MVWARRRRVGEAGAICVSGVLCSGSKGKSRLFWGSRGRGVSGASQTAQGMDNHVQPSGCNMHASKCECTGRPRQKHSHRPLTRIHTHTGIAATCALATQVPRWGGRHRASLTCSETADTACDHRLAQSNSCLSLPTKSPRTSLCYTSLDFCCFGLHA